LHSGQNQLLWSSFDCGFCKTPDKQNTDFTKEVKNHNILVNVVVKIKKAYLLTMFLKVQQKTSTSSIKRICQRWGKPRLRFNIIIVPINEKKIH
jgi:hypothetical protein